MIIFDVEASGTDSGKHSIVSIGAINMADISDQFYGECRIWDGAHIEPAALAVNGFTEQSLNDQTKQSETDLTKAFIDWVVKHEDQTLGGINPLFDISFVRAAALRGHLNYPFADRTIDLHSIVYFIHKQEGKEIPMHNHHSDINSDYIMNYVGLPAEPHPHNALNGALWEAEALHRLLYKQPLLNQFNQYPYENVTY